MLGMGLLTYITRVGGYWLGRRLPRTGRVRAGLEAIPGAVLISLVAPELLTGQLPPLLAGGATLAVMIVSRSMPLAMLAGVALIYLCRSSGLY